jgi:hypothetical protein
VPPRCDGQESGCVLSAPGEDDSERAEAPATCELRSTSARSLTSADEPGMNDGGVRDGAVDFQRKAVSDGRITIEFKRGPYVHVDRGFDPETLGRVLDVLGRT